MCETCGQQQYIRKHMGAGAQGEGCSMIHESMANSAGVRQQQGRGVRMQGAWEQGRMKEPITREEAKRAGKKKGGGGRRNVSLCI